MPIVGFDRQSSQFCGGQLRDSSLVRCLSTRHLTGEPLTGPPPRPASSQLRNSFLAPTSLSRLWICHPRHHGALRMTTIMTSLPPTRPTFPSRNTPSPTPSDSSSTSSSSRSSSFDAGRPISYSSAQHPCPHMRVFVQQLYKAYWGASKQ